MVLLTVRSLGSFLRTLSYSAMAFCSLPCWTNFSAALRIFCLLKPKPKAIGLRTPAFFPPNARDFRQRCRTGPNLAGRFPDETPQTAQPGSRSKVIVRLGRVSPMVTDDYRGSPKGSVRPVTEKPASRFQNRSKKTLPRCRTATRCQRDRAQTNAARRRRRASFGLKAGWPSAPALPPETSLCPLAFAGRVLDCQSLRARLPRGPFA